MTKKEMIETLQQIETKAWENLAKYEFENMPICTPEEEEIWTKTDQKYRNKLGRWSELNKALEMCKIESLYSEKAQKLANEVYKRNKEYRDKLKAGA